MSTILARFKKLYKCWCICVNEIIIMNGFTKEGNEWVFIYILCFKNGIVLELNVSIY